MNELCCKINPWVICRSCDRYYCEEHWFPTKQGDHIFRNATLALVPLEIYCNVSCKAVKWRDADKLGVPTRHTELSELIPEENTK
jgi:hypothetical protein